MENRADPKVELIALITIISSIIVPTIVLPVLFIKLDWTKQLAALMKNRFISTHIIEKISDVVFISVASAIFAFAATLICNAIKKDIEEKINVKAAFINAGLSFIAGASIAVLQELIGGWLEDKYKIAIVSFGVALAVVDAILLTFMPLDREFL